MPLFSNSPHLVCTHCLSALCARPNPRLIGTLIDESGAVSGGKLLWTDEAWEQLLGRKVGEMGHLGGEGWREVEQRLLFLRVWLLVGWWSEGARLVVLRVGSI